MNNKKITIFDHETHPVWADKYNKFVAINGGTNGAYTYSKDIVKFHVPELIKLIEQTDYKNILIHTVGVLTKEILPENIDLIIYYLHEHEKREIPRMNAIREFYKGKIVYITYRTYRAEKLNKLGFNTIFLPMSIDTEELARYKNHTKYNDKRVLWFGNMYLGKATNYTKVKKIFKREGWMFDTLTGNRLNDGKLLSRSKVFKEISKYKYGIGVGRAVLEMNALGVRTLICAKKVNGIITSILDFEYMKQNNFTDVDVPVFSDDIKKCLLSFDRAIIKTSDVRDVLPLIREIKL